MKAIWNSQVIAQSDRTRVIEGNHYFPEESINKEYFTDSEHTSICPWKGKANYFSIDVKGSVNENAAWYYANPSPLAAAIKDHVAFWKGVEIVED